REDSAQARSRGSQAAESPLAVEKAEQEQTQMIHNRARATEFCTSFKAGSQCRPVVGLSVALEFNISVTETLLGDMAIPPAKPPLLKAAFVDRFIRLPALLLLIIL